MKTAQDIAQRVTEEARIKIKTVYGRKARAPKIRVGDKVLVKILKFESKHKIEDRYEDDIYTVVGQPNIQIPARPENGTEKRLHQNHLFLLGFIDNKTEDEDTGDGEDGKKEDLDGKNHGKENRKDEEKKKTAAVADEQAIDVDPEIKEVSDKDENPEIIKQTEIEIEYSDDEDDDSEIEFVSQTYATGDAWKSGFHTSHDAGPVLADKIEDLTAGAQDKEKKKINDSDTDVTESKVVETATDNEDEIDVLLDDGDPHKDDTKEPEAEVEEGATDGILPRRSTREKKRKKKAV